MMKKITFILFALTLSLSLQAKVVTKDVALEVAARFFDLTSTRAAYPQLTLVWDGEEALTRSATDPTFFVFNNSDGGYVIISGDDAAMPVLGYSRKGSFDMDNMPVNMKAWMMTYREQILYLRINNILASGLISRKWLEVGVKTRSGASVEKILNTALWDQEAPFYNDCPLEDGEHCYTGCGPTSMSIIMYYHRIPYGKILDEDDVTVLDGFDWDNMLFSYKDGYTKAQAASVARLMAENGSRAQASYSTSGTGVVAEDMLSAYQNYKYADGTGVFDSGIKWVYASDYSSEDWEQMIYDDIDAGMPIDYLGYNLIPWGGHAFVLDGYGADSYFHFNWGWSGSYNGMFLLSVMGSDSMGYHFTVNQHAIFGIKSALAGSSASLSLAGTDAPVIESGSINSNGDPFKIKFSGITNTGSAPYSGTLKVAVVGVDGSVKSYCAESSIEGLAENATTSVTFTAVTNEPLKVGDKFMLCYSKMGSTSIVRSSSATVPESLPVYQMYGIAMESGGYSSGDCFVFSLTNSNKAYSSVEWSYDGSVTAKSSVTLTSGTHVVRCKISYPDGNTENLRQVLVVK